MSRSLRPLLFALLALATVPGRTRAADVSADLAAARAFEDREEWVPAESLATSVLSRLDTRREADSLQMAEALHLLGVAKWRRVGYADPVGPDAATRALGIRQRRLGADDLATAESHLLVARFLAGNGRNDSAIVHVRRALDIRTKRLAPDDTLIADTWDQLALAHRNRRDMRGALDAWQHAITIREHAEGPESPEIARLIAQTGVPYMELGELDRAHDVLEQSLAMFGRTSGPDAPGRVTALNILSDVEKRLGNDARRLDLLREALRVLRANGREETREGLTVRSNYALGLYEIGDPVGGIAIVQSLLPTLLAQYGPENPRTLFVRQSLGLASRALGDTATAMAQLHEVQAVLEKIAPDSPMVNLVRGQQGEIYYRQGRVAEARALHEQCVEVERAARPLRPATLGESESDLLRDLEAGADTAAITRTLSDMMQVYSTHRLAATYAGSAIQVEAARAARRLGQPEEAWRHALDAEQLSRERVALNLQLLPDRRALDFARNEQEYLEMVVLLARDGGAARLETAWDRLVRTRGLVRAEIMRRRSAPGFEIDTALATAHGRWLDAQRRLARRIVAAGGAPRDSASSEVLQRLQNAVEESESDYAKALAQRGVAPPPTDIGLVDVRARLAPRQALVGFYRSLRVTGQWFQIAPRDTSDFFAFVARGDGAVHLVPLGTSLELKAALDPWRERLGVSPGPRARPGDRAEEECRRLGRRARAAIWDRLAPYVSGATDVFLVCDDAMIDLPWAALPDGPHGYLVERGPRIHVLNAERELAESTPASSGGSLLALGGPDFDRGTPSSPPLVAALVRAAADPCAGSRNTALAPLPGAGAEARDVARAWRGEATVLTGAEATEAAFKSGAPGHAVLHLATHGVMASDTCGATPGLRGVGGLEALESGTHPQRVSSASPASTHPARRTPWMGRRIWLALAGANHAAADTVDENEGFLTAEEVLTLDLTGTDWVVLSACHSGLAEAWSRDGTLGMRRAFDLAGARTVIASQWSVEDEATREWMNALYAARAVGATSAAAAMESASRTVLTARRRSGRSTHPFYWAAFGASGE